MACLTTRIFLSEVKGRFRSLISRRERDIGSRTGVRKSPHLISEPLDSSGPNFDIGITDPRLQVLFPFLN